MNYKMVNVHQKLHDHILSVIENAISYAESRPPNVSLDQRFYKSSYPDINEVNYHAILGMKDWLNSKKVPKRKISDSFRFVIGLIRREQCPLNFVSTLLSQDSLFKNDLNLLLMAVEKPEITSQIKWKKCVLSAGYRLGLIKKCDFCKLAVHRSEEWQSKPPFKVCSEDPEVKVKQSTCDTIEYKIPIEHL